MELEDGTKAIVKEVSLLNKSFIVLVNDKYYKYSFHGTDVYSKQASVKFVYEKTSNLNKPTDSIKQTGGITLTLTKEEAATLVNLIGWGIGGLGERRNHTYSIWRQLESSLSSAIQEYPEWMSGSIVLR